jgi:hypothetical protein
MTNGFANTNIDEEKLYEKDENEDLVPNSQDYLNAIGGKKIIQLKK